jgi:SAM-dependent methyltransferase
VHLLKHDPAYHYELQKSNVAEVYDRMPIVGACLDVGGQEGRLRAFLDSSPKYLLVDPYLNAFDGIGPHTNIVRTNPFLLDPVNFVCAFGEHLPIRGASFNTLHMRIVIDHMYNPELALLEASRVLRAGGQLIIGSFVKGGASGNVRFSQKARAAVKSVLHLLGATRLAPHMWQPKIL